MYNTTIKCHPEKEESLKVSSSCHIRVFSYYGHLWVADLHIKTYIRISVKLLCDHFHC